MPKKNKCDVPECDHTNFAYNRCKTHDPDGYEEARKHKHEYSLKKYKSEKESIKTKSLEYYYNNIEKVRESKRKSYAKNRENACRKERERYKLVKERKKETSRLNYLRTKKTRLEQISNYNKQHPEVQLKSNKKRNEKLAKLNKMNGKAFAYASMSWSKFIKKEFDDKCVICGISGDKGQLHAHHLIHRKTAPTMALNENNGILLCVPHHKEIHLHSLDILYPFYKKHH